MELIYRMLHDHEALLHPTADEVASTERIPLAAMAVLSAIGRPAGRERDRGASQLTPLASGSRPILQDAGTLALSLDFELFWGMHDKRELGACARSLLGARDAIPRMLDLFERYGVRCTWATVGLLFFDRKDELLAHLPAERPRYVDPALSPYPRIAGIGPSERTDPYHYGLSLIRQIKECPGQEVATHTFSHYYCLEDGQTPETFRADLQAAVRAAARLDIALRSLVFPRNQYSAPHLSICADLGIGAVRGNQPSWLYRSARTRDQSPIKRAGRLLDHYLPLTGANTVRPERHPSGVINVPASRLLLAHSTRLGWLRPLNLERIAASMTRAATTGAIYHLWWHPHNFGAAVDENLRVLIKILERYRRLSETHGMVSRSMAEIADAVRQDQERAAASPRPASPEPGSICGSTSGSTGTLPLPGIARRDILAGGP